VQRWRARPADRAGLGALVSAVEAQRLVRLILRERYSRSTLAAALGRRGHLAQLAHAQRITLRTFLRVRHFYRTHVLEPPNTPTSPDSPSVTN
jgi:hypothetical protein